MSKANTRRSFLKQSAMAGAGFWVASRPHAARAGSVHERVRAAVIGVGGQGSWNLGQLSEVDGVEIVGLCDVHESRKEIIESRAKFGKAKFFTDFRVLFDEMHQEIDAVLVATPDHTHAMPTLTALSLGKHIYCEKPLTHTLYECRLVREAARRAGVTTQMGTQIHARDNYRRVVELIQTKAIGDVTEVHVYVNREWGGKDRPKDTPPVPEGLHYDLWTGPAPYRPYSPEYVPSNWRAWWDFGGGTLADMACHYMDLPHWALELRYPVKIEAEGPPVHAESCPPQLTVRYDYPARKGMPPVKLTWRHGNQKLDYFERYKLPKFGDHCLFIGETGMLLADYDRYVLLPEEQYADFAPPEPFIPKSIGHHAEWVRGIRTGAPTMCNFEYAGLLTESVHLGNVAYRSGKTLHWDTENMMIPNAPEAMAYLHQPYRAGWRLPTNHVHRVRVPAGINGSAA